MNDFRALLRSLITFAIALPMAMVIGYMLAQDLSYTSLGVIGISIGILCIPLLFKWHHPLLFLSWNMSAVIFILPGRPDAWLVMAFLSGGFVLLEAALKPGHRSLQTFSITVPIIVLGVAVICTAFLTGGLGFRVMGSGSVGGKRYLMMFGAIVAYFAMTSRQMPRESVWLYVGLFFLGGLTNLIAEAYPFLPVNFRFVYWLFPVNRNTLMSPDDSFAFTDMGRSYGLAVACLALCFYLLARYGLKNMLDSKKTWRLVLFGVAAFLSLIGGFRTFFILLAITCFFLFYLEGLMRTKYLPVLVVGGVLSFAAVIALGDKLPLSIQRSLSVIPWVEVSPVARHNALASTEWRVAMWKELLPQIPEYFWLGKGYGISADDFALSSELAGMSTAKSAEMASLGLTTTITDPVRAYSLSGFGVY